METRIVLGFYPQYQPGPYALVPVAAEYVFGKLEKVPDIRGRFPNNGEVYIHERNIPEDFARLSAGVWEVRYIERANDEDDRGDRFAHFVSMAILPAPHEIIYVGCSSEEPEVARELLLAGIPLPYRLTADPLIEFDDGVIAGPLKTSLRPEGTGFRCSELAFTLPLKAWKKRGALDSLTFSNQSQPRTFVWQTPLPKNDFLIDLSPWQEAIRSVVKFISKEGPGSYIISKKEQDLLAEKLSAGGLPEWVAARRERILRLLQESVDTQEQLDVLMEVLLVHPKVKARFEAEEKRVLEMGKRNLHLKEEALIKRIIDLNADEKRLNQSLEGISAKIKEEEVRGLRQADELEQAIRARALKAKEEVGALLAEVAILQPFFGTSVESAPTQVASSAVPEEFREWTPGATPKTFPEAVSNLQSNLAFLGLHPLSGRALARDVLAAVSSRQLVLFQGSMGGVVTRLVARTLACRSVTTLQVPIGFRENTDFESVVKRANREGAFAALIIEGVNRSCVDAYGSYLTQLVTDRIFGLGDPMPNLILLGNVLDGPSSLPPGSGLTSLGPIFHTDCLSWITPGPNGKMVDGHLSAFPAPESVASPADVGTLNGWSKALSGTPSALWSRNVESVLKALSCRPDKGTYPSALESVTFGWLLPRAVATGVDLAGCTELIADARKDARVESFLRDVTHLPARAGA